MPDFEALIRHQQQQQPTNDRLTLIKGEPNKKDSSLIQTKAKNQSRGLGTFFGALTGAFLGSFGAILISDNRISIESFINNFLKG